MSTSKADFEPRRFRANVPYYSRFRLGYPETLIARVCAATGTRAGHRVMDLGCGPGLLAIPFARAGMSVLAIDPEPDMLSALVAEARDARVCIDAREGSSFQMPHDIGRSRLTVIGRAFHWMDRSDTLNMLDGIIEPGGAVVLFHDEHPHTAENRWRQTLHEISNTYGRAHSPHVREAESAEYRTHESILLDSVFSAVERVGVFVRRTLTLDDIVGLALSLSSSSPEKLGDRIADFKRDLRLALEKLSADGRFTEIAELAAVIARRP